MTAREVLEAAAKRIDEKGLYKNGYCAPVHGGYVFIRKLTMGDFAEVGACDATGSLRIVAFDEDAAVNEAKELLRKEIGGWSISDWSDEHTAEEVAGVMRKAAASCP